MTAPGAFQSPLADGIERLLTYKRALGRRFDTEEKQLRLFDRFLVHQALTSLEQITPERVAEFLAVGAIPGDDGIETSQLSDNAFRRMSRRLRERTGATPRRVAGSGWCPPCSSCQSRFDH